MSNSTLIIASSSDPQAWPYTTRAIADLIAKLTPAAIHAVHVLGTDLSWRAEDWQPNMPLLPEVQGVHPFVAPVLRSLSKPPETVILVGSGEVMDLADWAHSDTNTRWALVRTGTAALQPPGLGLSEVGLNQIHRVLNLPPALRSRTRPTSLSTGSVSDRWRLDKSGYPMVFVPPLKAHVHLFSLTKSQFEHFLANAKQTERNPAWYAEVLKLNPRRAPHTVAADETEMLFISGLLPADAEAFMRWHGRGLTWLNPQQWLTAHDWLGNQPISALPFDVAEAMTPTATWLWQSFVEARAPRTLADLGCMEEGIVDWVRDGSRMVGMGQPTTRLGGGFHNLREPHVPTSLQHRSVMFGGRFMDPT